MTRHGSLSEQLQAVLSYRNRPEGAVEPVQTNWTATPANDNNPEDLDGMRVERRWAMRPTPDEIMAEVEKDEVVTGEAVDDDGNKHKIIISIGRLRFSDGTQTERGHKLVMGKVVDAQIRMPVGAMLGARDRQERVLGGDAVTSNSAYTTVYGGKHPNKVKRKPKAAAATRKDYSHQESIALLARAKEATLDMPPVKKCPDGFPWKPSNLRELFSGLEKTPSGETGSIEWRDISAHIADREVWIATVAAVSAKTRVVLEAAMTANSFADLSEPASRRTAIRRGRANLIAANDDLMSAINNIAA